MNTYVLLHFEHKNDVTIIVKPCIELQVTGEQMQQKIVSLSQYFTGSQTKTVSVAASTCFTVILQCNLQHDVKVVSHDRNR